MAAQPDLYQPGLKSRLFVFSCKDSFTVRIYNRLLALVYRKTDFTPFLNKWLYKSRKSSFSSANIRKIDRMDNTLGQIMYMYYIYENDFYTSSLVHYLHVYAFHSSSKGNIAHKTKYWYMYMTHCIHVDAIETKPKIIISGSMNSDKFVCAYVQYIICL